MPEALSLDASGDFFVLPASFLVPELASGGFFVLPVEAPATSPAMKRRDDAAFCMNCPVCVDNSYLLCVNLEKKFTKP